MLLFKEKIIMEKELRVQLLKSGGKKALENYNRLNRATGPDMNLGTRVHEDLRYKRPKHKNRVFEEV
jgi:hypothetical protein